MNWLDIVIIILLVIQFFTGLTTGLLRGLLSLIGLVAGIILAGQFYTQLAGALTFIHDERWADVAAFAIILLVVWIIGLLLGSLLHKAVKAVMLGWLDTLLGALLGVVIGAVFIAALLAVWVEFFGGDPVITGSVMATFLLDRFPIVLGLLPGSFGDTVRGFFK